MNPLIAEIENILPNCQPIQFLDRLTPADLLKLKEKNLPSMNATKVLSKSYSRTLPPLPPRLSRTAKPLRPIWDQIQIPTRKLLNIQPLLKEMPELVSKKRVKAVAGDLLSVLGDIFNHALGGAEFFNTANMETPLKGFLFDSQGRQYPFERLMSVGIDTIKVGGKELSLSFFHSCQVFVSAATPDSKITEIQQTFLTSPLAKIPEQIGALNRELIGGSYDGDWRCDSLEDYFCEEGVENLTGIPLLMSHVSGESEDPWAVTVQAFIEGKGSVKGLVNMILFDDDTNIGPQVAEQIAPHCRDLVLDPKFLDPLFDAYYQPGLRKVPVLKLEGEGSDSFFADIIKELPEYETTAGHQAIISYGGEDPDLILTEASDLQYARLWNQCFDQLTAAIPYIVWDNSGCYGEIDEPEHIERVVEFMTDVCEVYLKSREK